MSTMISEVYDAFRSVGVDEAKARAAAEAISSDQLATKTDVAVLKWMLGFVIVMVTATFWKTFS